MLARSGLNLAPDQACAIPPGVSIFPQTIARVNAPWPRGRALAHLQCGAALMRGILTVAEAARRIAVKQLSPVEPWN
jgi:hypothetical protein